MPNNFTPLSHEQLKILWDMTEHLPRFIDVRRIILSAIWWETMEGRANHIVDWEVAPAAHQKCKLCRRGPRDWFLTRLAEVGIDWREDG